MIPGRLVAGLQALTGVAFVGIGGSIAGGVGEQAKEFERFGYPGWFRTATGLSEVAGGLGVLAGLRFGQLAFPAGLLLCVLMVGAAYTHVVRARDPLQKAVPAFVALALVALVTGSCLPRSRRG